MRPSGPTWASWNETMSARRMRRIRDSLPFGSRPYGWSFGNTSRASSRNARVRVSSASMRTSFRSSPRTRSISFGGNVGRAWNRTTVRWSSTRYVRATDRICSARTFSIFARSASPKSHEPRPSPALRRIPWNVTPSCSYRAQARTCARARASSAFGGGAFRSFSTSRSRTASTRSREAPRARVTLAISNAGSSFISCRTPTSVARRASTSARYRRFERGRQSPAANGTMPRHPPRTVARRTSAGGSSWLAARGWHSPGKGGARARRPDGEVGLVLRAFPLADYDGPLRLDLFRVERRVPHALRLDHEGRVHRARGDRLEVHRVIRVGEGVHLAAEAGNHLVGVPLAELATALEQHVLDPMRRAGHPGDLVPRADAVHDPRGQRLRVRDWPEDDLQAIVQRLYAGGHPTGGKAGGRYQVARDSSGRQSPGGSQRLKP